jgi:hypothetical protein
VARRKIVFVIVEGPSDDEALGVLLERMYDKNTVHIHITHGDVTTEKGASFSTILAMLGGIIETYRNANHLTKTHFKEIVHIVDMDGAYIPDDAVIGDVTAKKPSYSLTEIRTADVRGIINRNMMKRGCVDKISSTPTLCGIPYQAYYMSCNLDHVLYEKLNSTDEKKERDSLSFAKKYGSNILDFVNFISESSFSVGGTYLESWSFIKEKKHSLERHTNFGICIARALKGQNASRNTGETEQ